MVYKILEQVIATVSKFTSDPQVIEILRAIQEWFSWEWLTKL